MYFFRQQTARDEEDVRLHEAEALEAARRHDAPIEDEGPAAAPSYAPQSHAVNTFGVDEHSARFQIEADEEDEEDEADLGTSRSARRS